MSSQSQATLLKVLEESNSGIFFVLCTTNVEKILPTIRSRALKLRFDLIGTQDILNNLKGIVEKNNYTISDDILGFANAIISAIFCLLFRIKKEAEFNQLLFLCLNTIVFFSYFF